MCGLPSSCANAIKGCGWAQFSNTNFHANAELTCITNRIWGDIVVHDCRGASTCRRAAALAPWQGFSCRLCTCMKRTLHSASTTAAVMRLCSGFRMC